MTAQIIQLAAGRDLHQQRVRMSEILRRHVRAEDKGLSDREFTAKVFERWYASLSDALIDPAE